MRATSNEYSESWLETLFPPSPLIAKRLAPENLYPDTAAQLSPLLTGFLISTRAFRGPMRQQLSLAQRSRRLNSQRTGVISECWWGSWQENLSVRRHHSVRRSPGTRKTNHVVTRKNQSDHGWLPRARNFFEKKI